MEMTEREILDMKEKVDRMYLIIVGDERYGIPGMASRIEEQNNAIEERLAAIEEENEQNRQLRRNLTLGYRALVVLAGVAGFIIDKVLDLIQNK